MSGNSFFESKKFKGFMKYLYGWGAAIVIFGALFKIMHWPFSGPLLVVGLSTEALIFFFSAFEPLHADVDWTLVYPELALGHSEDSAHALPTIDEEENDQSIVEQLDNMLVEAKIEPELIESLGDGLRNLSSSTKDLGNITSAAAASDEFVGSLKSASGKVDELTDAYAKASSSLTEITEAANDGTSFGEQMQKVAGQLASLNAVYELQLKGASEHLSVTEQMYGGINELMTNLHSSLDDTKKYKETMASLSQNLSALNTVYGNMLSAMNVNSNG